MPRSLAGEPEADRLEVFRDGRAQGRASLARFRAHTRADLAVTGACEWWVEPGLRVSGRTGTNAVDKGSVQRSRWREGAGFLAQLFEVEPFDPAILAALSFTAALSPWLPARRITRIDPVNAPAPSRTPDRTRTRSRSRTRARARDRQLNR